MAQPRNQSVYINPQNHQFEMKGTPLPEPGQNEVLLTVQCTGICATDVHLWSWGQIGNIQVNAPAVLGHESCGKVLKVGPGVQKLKIGDRVAIESSTPCYACEFCLRGSYHLCPDLKCYGLPPNNGLYTRFFVHDANFCFKLPANVSDEEGAMVEPLSVAVHACRRAQVSAGDHVLVCGAGPIGLLVMMVAKAMGAAKVLITDIRQDRLEFASKLKADHILLIGNDSETKTAKTIRETLGQAPVITLDCCGFEKSLKTSIHATKSGGVVIVVGLGRGEMKLPIVEATLREVDIKGVVRYPNCYRRSIDLIASGIIDVKPLITHRFKLSDVPKAFQLAKDGNDGAIKVMINCQQ